MRCRRAHWFLSAQCDDTLSEKHRRELAAHVEECPSCRREAFYFSEIKGQTGKMDRVRARVDFNLRLRARVRAWDTAQEEVKSTRSQIRFSLVDRLSGLGGRVVDISMIVFGQRRYALVGVASMLLVVAVWTGYRITVGPEPDGSDFSQPIASALTEAQRADGFYLAGMTEAGEQNRGYVMPAVSLSDDISPRTQPNYVLPTIPAEQVTAREVF